MADSKCTWRVKFLTVFWFCVIVLQKEKNGKRTTVAFSHHLVKSESKNLQKNNTQDSNVVPHHSTNWARTCLTLLSRREAVLSCWCGRSQHCAKNVGAHAPHTGKKWVHTCLHMTCSIRAVWTHRACMHWCNPPCKLRACGFPQHGVRVQHSSVLKPKKMLKLEWPFWLQCFF